MGTIISKVDSRANRKIEEPKRRSKNQRPSPLHVHEFHTRTKLKAIAYVQRPQFRFVQTLYELLQSPWVHMSFVQLFQRETSLVSIVLGYHIATRMLYNSSCLSPRSCYPFCPPPSHLIFLLSPPHALCFSPPRKSTELWFKGKLGGRSFRGDVYFKEAVYGRQVLGGCILVPFLYLSR